MAQFAGQITAGPGTAAGYAPCDGRRVSGLLWRDYYRHIGRQAGGGGICLARVPVSAGNQVRLADDPLATELANTTPIVGSPHAKLAVNNPGNQRGTPPVPVPVTGYVWPPDLAVTYRLMKSGAQNGGGSSVVTGTAVSLVSLTISSPGNYQIVLETTGASGSQAAWSPVFSL